MAFLRLEDFQVEGLYTLLNLTMKCARYVITNKYGGQRNAEGLNGIKGIGYV